MAIGAYALPPAEVVPARGAALGEFAELRDILARVVAVQGCGGAALAVYRDGRPVVDLVAGDYPDDAVQSVFSVSKAFAAIQAARLHADGRLDLDAPLADVWPEFAKPSTAAITTRMVLSHRSGIPAVDRVLSLEQLVAGEDDAAVGAQEPYWEPGTRHGYHSFSYGTLLDGVVRRAVGRGVAELFAEEVAGPLGLEFWFAIPEPEAGRVQPVLRPTVAATERTAAVAARATIPPGHTSRLAGQLDIYNHPLYRTSGWLATGGIASARGLARGMAATMGPVDGVRLLDESAQAGLVAERSWGIDAVLGIPIRFGSGVQLPFPQLPMLSPGSYGHEAAGGSVALADPAMGLAVGFTTSRFPPQPGAGMGFDTLMSAIRYCVDRRSEMEAL